MKKNEFDLLDDDNDIITNKAPLIGESSSLKTSSSSSSTAFQGSKFKLSLGSSSSKTSRDCEKYESLKDSDEEGSLCGKSKMTIGHVKVHRKRFRTESNSRRESCCAKLLYFLFLVCCLFVVFFYAFKNDFQKLYMSKTFSYGKDSRSKCHRMNSSVVWRQNFPMLTIESALRMIDINDDQHLDVVVPFGTGIDAAYYDSTLCEIYFNESSTEASQVGCGGGVLAIDGKSGEPLWAQYTQHELFGSNCNIDLNQDGKLDCVLSGRMAGLYAIDGKTGTILWSIDSTYGSPISETSNFYTPLFIPRDIDGDSVPDLIVMHGGDPLRKKNDPISNIAKLMVISAKTGRIISWNRVPKDAESYYSPQLIINPDGTAFIMFGTGGETRPGGLYIVPLDACFKNQTEFMRHVRTIYEDCCKGVIAPPALVDLNNDAILDIVLANFNSSVMAFDGLTLSLIWKRTFVGSETYSSPAVAFFNDDQIVDIAVQYQFGPGFPIYDYANLHVLDGRNGNDLISPIRMLIGAQSSPLSVISLAANDFFLYWFTDCTNSKLTIDNFNTIDTKSSTVFQSSRADFCKLRFGPDSKQYTQFRALSQTSNQILYDSRFDEPNYERLNFTQIVLNWLQTRFNSNEDIAGGTNGGVVGDGGRTVIGGGGGGFFGDGNGGVGGSGFASASGSGGARSDNGIDYHIIRSGGGGDGDGGIPETWNSVFRRTRKRNEQSTYVRSRRHVGLHNGDQIQRVISTGTLAPPLMLLNGHGQMPLDGSIDVIFATYSFPAVTLLSEKSQSKISNELQKCLDKYMSAQAETDLRLSNIAKLSMDHDAFVETIEEYCRQQIEQMNIPESEPSSEEKIQKLIKNMGSMTVHRLNMKCYDDTNQQNALKEYRFQWWPAYLGYNADSVTNIVE